jgi:hypothetical protein
MQPSNIYQIAGTAAVILSIAAFVPYVRSIFKNETKPSGASWWTWSLLAIITVISSRAAGASWEVLMLPMWLFLSQLYIAVLSIKKGDNNWDTSNKLCILGAILGIIFWVITGQPLVALIFSIIADLFASIPNWRHVWKNPEQENMLAWGLGWGSAVLEIFTIKTWSWAESGWAIYFLMTVSITFFLVSRQKFKNTKS